MLRATMQLAPFSMGQYVRDVRTGNAPFGHVMKVMAIALFNKYQRISQRFVPAKLRYRNGLPYPFVEGGNVGKSVPAAGLDLVVGEHVRVRSLGDRAAAQPGSYKSRSLVRPGTIRSVRARVHGEGPHCSHHRRTVRSNAHAEGLCDSRRHRVRWLAPPVVPTLGLRLLARKGWLERQPDVPRGRLHLPVR